MKVTLFSLFPQGKREKSVTRLSTRPKITMIEKKGFLMTIKLREVSVPDATLISYISREVKKGRLRKLGRRVYMTNLKEVEESLVKRHA